MPIVEKIRLVIAFLYAIRSIGASIQPAEGILDAGNDLRNLVLMRFPHDVVLTPKLYKSCAEAWRAGFHRPGIYPIALNVTATSTMDARWTFIICNNSIARSSTVILLRRPSGGEQFERDFGEYERGFGSAKKDYFLGLQAIRNLTSTGFNRLTITVEDAAGSTRQMCYRSFQLDGPPNYAFQLAEPGVGDLPDDFWFHRNRSFTAPGREDKRSDGMSCAKRLNVGWWFLDTGTCALTLMTGRFSSNRTMCHPRLPYPACNGVYWMDWMGFRSLEHVTMELSR